MKTTFTLSIIRTFIITLIVALPAMNLAAQTSHQVTVTDGQFTPKDLIIEAGDTVIWTNTGTNAHNVNGTQTTFPTNPESFGNEVGLGWTYEYIFNTVGFYNYQCDPHAAFGMVGTVTVNQATEDTLKLMVNFTAMTPHVGQPLWLAVIDTTTHMEVGRVKHQVTTANFSLEVPGIEEGKGYHVDFWADHSGNGFYDVPPVDHAWRLVLDEVDGDEALDFVHNTNFTDIEWKLKLTVHFTAMTPHVGQLFTLFVRDEAGTYLDTVVIDELTEAEFHVSSWAVDTAQSYMIDFWADLNMNGTYNAPPADHAWRLEIDSLVSDTTINFVHNTSFTDIMLATANDDLLGDKGNFRLYPNPASQYIDLLISGNSSKASLFKVYSVTGKLIDQKVLGNVESYRYNLDGYKNGVYFIELSSGGKTSVLKFLKQ
ncbi:MAG TPA: plastocyanin/azurin family copper-binding protein [Prolixibacteraceae bacterium]|nr:plastocyanin/azurin family copper-binding protein [Prolixibacteraceae bacterium]